MRARPGVLSQPGVTVPFYRDHPDDGLLAVSEEYQVGRTTAWRYVDRARKAGYSVKQRKRAKQ